MKSTSPCVLTLNGGSSSIRFAVFATTGKSRRAQLTRVLSGKIDRIGVKGTTFTSKDEGLEESNLTLGTYDLARSTKFLLGYLSKCPLLPRIRAIGHRVVLGMQHSEPQRVNAKLMQEMRRVTLYDPDHLPGEIGLIDSFAKQFPALPQIVCFDSSFHRTMPQVAKTLPIPRKLSRGVERFGFHGLSYQFLLEELARINPKESKGRIILAHLGNGASMAAVHHGKSIDTTMGFTPAAGLVMSTRTGDIDPGLVYLLSRTQNMSPAAFQKMANHKSGMLGISGTSSDVRDLLTRENDDHRAAEALELFCYQARKFIGAYAAALGGLDTIVFAGGIGENSAVIRERICEGLEFLGVGLDRKSNSKNATVISRSSARVKVRVMKTDEELMIGRSVIRLLGVGDKRRTT